jgi:uncharacterized membrane protein YfcA
LIGGVAGDGWLVAAVGIIVFAGVVKSVTGLGIPVVGTPLLVLIYGHLAIVVAVMSIPTTVCSGYFVWRTRGHVQGVLVTLGLLLPCGVIGVVAGTHLLVTVPTRILAGVLAGVIAVFVISQVARRAQPAVGERASPALAPVVGVLSGALQGTSGASGPLVTMYLLRRPLSRNAFFFAANAAFLVFDLTQMATLANLGQLTPGRAAGGALALVPLFGGVWAGAWLARRVDDHLFRYGVLAILAVTAVSLGARALA